MAGAGVAGAAGASEITILAFSYAGRADADVWWHASGCQSLDNGYVATTETVNPSFYNNLGKAIQHLPG